MVLNSDGTTKPFRNQKSSAGRSALAKPGLQARAAAAKILAAVVDRKLPLDGALDHEHGNPAYKALGESDRALVRAILNTTLRHLPRIDAAIDSLLESPLPEGARALHHVLAIGAAQILYLDVPDHSAVDLAVEQANQDPRNRRFAKLVNAVLRRLGREKDEVLVRIEKVPPMPTWFLSRLEKAYGRDAALAISQSQLEPAAIDLTVKADAEAWAKRLNGVALPTGGVRLAAFEGGIPSLEGFDEGAWWVQDAAASIPARLFGNLSGKRAADLCAAPGGKTAQLILAGGVVTALDQSESRLRRLRSNLDRLGLEADTVATDLTTFRPTEGFDAILLDAPCSSTGTTRRHPDVLWTKGPDDIARLAALQERLLRHALTLLKPGGTLVFSNCSLDPAEGEEVVARVLSDADAIERVPISAGDWPSLEAAITPLGEFRTLPTMLKMPEGIASGLDGFYAAVLRRAA
ncbi:RsmB/NOP family class I SAM-dependent RNA methyltransferase [Rhizobium bangladeshense]|uniref:RsmB/NOP family class I SAM-dependent RNA methyltransferase n=1 Tax=Rhizobium bangladeshense TaxID=1138189 RepID=UPI001C82FB87|nr:RsmB/NOP family class I SAM-dependent RNA methyltransferase [Rhizobium bangladeshense]MBX4897667.1 MFS transporter [Rhizobium bangladeshense]MBX4905372.1 MFS transporter [Rhizobium bangladeshense]MBX4917593.1 MFS transporter [Rhizobium bangladeshense]MBY3615125.1 MFS transporter [Rhizobium bangladeshense]